mmetsp:Transcript_1376/g.4166  ORF Transcript_1376/g.4166 Transcript_1376/m.4166 type:complete len:152 (+) Transcript_1376:155-610(+)
MGRLQFTRIDNSHLFLGCTRIGPLCFNLLDKIFPIQDFSKHNMTSIQPGSLDGGNEKLRSIGVGSSIGHTQIHGSFVLELKVFIGKLFTENAFSSTTIEMSKITSLNHKVGNDTVKDGSLVMKGFARLSSSLFSRAKCTKVFHRLGYIFTK